MHNGEHINIFRPEKRIWLISLVLSVIYFFTFTLAARGVFEDGLLFGFCVWGSPDLPNTDDGCEYSPWNSHIIAFGIDFIMTLAVGIFYLRDRSPNRQRLLYIAVAAIIFLHGVLHLFLSSPIIDCYEKIEPGSLIEKIGYVLFTFFTFFLCLFIQGFGFGLSRKVFIGSGIFTIIVVLVTLTIGNGEYFLPGLFCIVHPLSSFVGLCTNNASFSSTVGMWFAIATFVGIVELSSCPNFFREFGGHFYYDLTLHTAVILSLPYFTDSANIARHDHMD